MSKQSLTPFANQIRVNVIKKVAQLKRLGTVGMSLDNLCQVTPTPPYGLTGEASSPVHYRQLFSEVVRGIPAVWNNFITPRD